MFTEITNQYRHLVYKINEQMFKGIIPNKFVCFGLESMQSKESGDIIHYGIQCPYETTLFAVVNQINRYKLYHEISLDKFPNLLIYVEITLDDIQKFGVHDCVSLSCLISLPDDRSYKELQRKNYTDYLKSNAWRKFKADIFKERGFKCEICNNKRNLELHHLTYKNFGKEKSDDVMILCQRCHEQAHSN